MCSNFVVLDAEVLRARVPLLVVALMAHSRGLIPQVRDGVQLQWLWSLKLWPARESAHRVVDLPTCSEIVTLGAIRSATTQSNNLICRPN